jgi:hypothetical protein
VGIVSLPYTIPTTNRTAPTNIAIMHNATSSQAQKLSLFYFIIAFVSRDWFVLSGFAEHWYYLYC